MNITFVTSNKGKLQEVAAILGDKYTIISKSIDLPELQGTPEEIAYAKCKSASQLIDGPVLIDDTSLCFNALGGLPGVYVRSFIDTIGNDGLVKLLAGFDDKSAYAQCIFAYATNSHTEPILFNGRTYGSIVSPRGSTAFGWDCIFEVEKTGLTFAEMDSDTKNSLSHRRRALNHFRDYIM